MKLSIPWKDWKKGNKILKTFIKKTLRFTQIIHFKSNCNIPHLNCSFVGIITPAAKWNKFPLPPAPIVSDHLKSPHPAKLIELKLAEKRKQIKNITFPGKIKQISTSKWPPASSAGHFSNQKKKRREECKFSSPASTRQETRWDETRAILHAIHYCHRSILFPSKFPSPRRQ